MGEPRTLLDHAERAHPGLTEKFLEVCARRSPFTQGADRDLVFKPCGDEPYRYVCRHPLPKLP